MTEPGVRGMDRDPLNTVLEYHERTKHRPDRYARSLGYLDWAAQPDPFRSFDGAPQLSLAEPPLRARPGYDELFLPDAVEPEPLDRRMISRLFYHFLALSAWKQAPGIRPWSLRINPSSGALHPTEGYIIAGPIEGLSSEAAVYHYFPFRHALEKLLPLEKGEWEALAAQLPPGTFLIALTSIYWRESWKYGERAFRYCNHDVGHAIGALAFSAAALGWRTRLIDGISDDALALLLGLRRQQGIEAEHPDCLLAVMPRSEITRAGIDLRLPSSLCERLERAQFSGTANRLSTSHHPWPVIDEVAAAARFIAPVERLDAAGESELRAAAPLDAQERGSSAEQIIRRRRSAVAMDGETEIDREVFYRMLARLMPDGVASPQKAGRLPKLPFDVWPWRPRISLLIFVHRILRLPSGLYLLSRDAGHESGLRATCRGEFLWRDPEGCPDGVALRLLEEGDFRRVARTISCHQDIASDGVFSLGMLAEFEGSLRELGPWFYPRLFWETGLIGQVLYLEAEAAGIRGTGIGCFFDDAVHELLGMGDRSWQSLYHFTVGGAVDDPRLSTLPPYGHLDPR